jgi:tRNA G18 (ribose-2'-O)-methylase SpoU
MKSRNFDRPSREIVVIAHNIRSVLNVGAILRTAEGFGIKRVFASGYTPNLEHATGGNNTKLLPHVREKLRKELHKTALGVEEIVDFRFAQNVLELIQKLRADGYRIVGLEQDDRAILLPEYNVIARSKATQQSSNDHASSGLLRCSRNDEAKIALLLGEEVHGLTNELRDVCDDLVEIPMFGRKESFNVSVAAGIALYHFTATHSAP